MNKYGEREEQIEPWFICFATTCLYFQEDYSNLLLQLPWNNFLMAHLSMIISHKEKAEANLMFPDQRSRTSMMLPTISRDITASHLLGHFTGKHSHVSR